MTYIPPIWTEFPNPIDDVIKMIKDEQENRIVCTVQSALGIRVDKHELVRALAYDRDQYEKGYYDGCNAALSERVYCKDCKEAYDPFIGTLKGQGYLKCRRYAIITHESKNFYCKDGERKETEDDREA